MSRRPAVVLVLFVTLLMVSLLPLQNAVAVPSCENGGPCAVGDVGPGGGKVFFVRSASTQTLQALFPDTSMNCLDYKRNGYWTDWMNVDPNSQMPAPVVYYSDPCVSTPMALTVTAAEQVGLSFDYLEVAPDSTEGVVSTWDGVNSLNSATGYVANANGTAIGTGASNTAAIVSARPNDNSSNNAAIRADQLTFGGKTDWFLPSTKELGFLMFQWAQTPVTFDQSSGDWVREDSPFGNFHTDQEYWASGGWDQAPPNGDPRVNSYNFPDGNMQSPWLWTPKYSRAIRAFSAQPAPTITAVSPATTSVAGGGVISISGTGFLADSTVSFDGVAVPTMTFIDSYHLFVVAPAGTPGPVTIEVTNPSGWSISDTNSLSFVAEEAVDTVIPTTSQSPNPAAAADTGSTTAAPAAPLTHTALALPRAEIVQSPNLPIRLRRDKTNQVCDRPMILSTGQRANVSITAKLTRALRAAMVPELIRVIEGKRGKLSVQVLTKEPVVVKVRFSAPPTKDTRAFRMVKIYRLR